MSIETKSPDNAALAALLERHRPALRRYVVRLLGGNAASAAGVLESVAKELRTLRPDEREEQMLELLFASARRHALKLGGGAGSGKRFDENENDPRPAKSGDGSGEPPEAEEPHVTMQRSIDRLTPKQQEAVRLRFQDGFSHEQVAGITELTVFNVGLLMHNALQRLDRDQRANQSQADGTADSGIGDDPRLTSYALGEMEENERGRFEDSLFDKKSAAARVEKIRALGTLVGRTLAIEAGAPAPHTVRRRKRAGISGWFRFPRVLLPVGVALTALMAAFFMFRGNSDDQKPDAQAKVDFSLKPANWREEAALPAEERRASGSSGDSGPSFTAFNPAATSTASRVHSENSPAAVAALDGAGAHTKAVSGNADHVTVAPTTPLPGGVTAILRGRSGEIGQSYSSAAAGGEAAPVQRKTDSSDQSAESEPESLGPKADKPDDTGANRSHQAVRHSDSSGTAKEQTERKFASPKDTAGSQLSPDVDTASVISLKAALASGRMPAPGGVKIEQLLNYFPLHCAEPDQTAVFAATLEAADAPWNPAHRLVRVSLKGRDAPATARGAANLVLLIDVSGSMDAPNKLPLVKEAVRRLLGHLRPDDRIGIVTYAEEPRLALLPTPASQTRDILRALEPLEAKGGTNGGAGLEFAYDLARAHFSEGGPNGIILCSDGDFNVGATREEDLARLIDREAKTQVTLSVLGFGRGRAIDPRLEAMAKHGGGRSGYINTRRDAELALVRELDELFEPLAKNVKIEVAFNPDRIQGYRLVGYDDVPDDLDAGAAPPDARTVLPGHALTALYEVVPTAGSSAGDMLTVKVSYQAPKDGVSHLQQFPLRDGGATFAQASLDFKFAAAVATFGLVLQDSPQKGSLTLDEVEAWARECLGEDEGGYRSEFLSLVEQARAARK